MVQGCPALRCLGGSPVHEQGPALAVASCEVVVRESSCSSQGKQSLHLPREAVVSHCVTEWGALLANPMTGTFLKWQH